MAWVEKSRAPELIASYDTFMQNEKKQKHRLLQFGEVYRS